MIENFGGKELEGSVITLEGLLKNELCVIYMILGFANRLLSFTSFSIADPKKVPGEFENDLFKMLIVQRRKKV